MLCDSNVIIYAADPSDTVCAKFVWDPQAHLASVTRIEVLGFQRFAALEAAHKERLIRLIATIPELRLDDAVIQRAIILRRSRKMTLADAIIGATALEYGMPLVTRNVADFSGIERLQLVNPFGP